MSEYGHHRRGELEFANPTWAERPDYVLGIVRGYVASEAGEDPLRLYERRAAEAEEAAEEARRRPGPLSRAAFERVLAWGRASASARENVKSEAVRWLSAIRRALVLVGERLAERGDLERADDVFYLTWEELAGVVAGEGDAGRPSAASRSLRLGLVAERSAERERLSRLRPPHVVVGTWDEVEERSELPLARTITGIGVSSGVARGRARVFASVDSHDDVSPGEILVAPFTDPGWTPYFIPAAGIVMDLGGLLSHGSIIAREYGIPAVVNVGPASRTIETGQLLEVDGDAGVVRILD